MVSSNWYKQMGPKITSGNLNSSSKGDQNIKLGIALARNNPLKTRVNSQNLLRTDPGGPGAPGNRTKRYETVHRVYLMLIVLDFTRFYSILVESGDYP